MTKNGINISIAIVIFTFLALGCDAWANLKGRVVDEAGQPLAGAKVRLYQDNKLMGEEITDKDGSFKFGNGISTISLGLFKITVVTDGFQEYEKRLSGRDVQQRQNDKELTIALKRS
jgi:hypothetical protein